MSDHASERVEVTPELLESLRQAAEAASPGPWIPCIGSASKRHWFDLPAGAPSVSPNGESCKCRMVYGNSGPPVVYALFSGDESFTGGEGATAGQARANARFVGAANPAVVFALVERIRELEREVAAMEDHMEQLRDETWDTTP